MSNAAGGAPPTGSAGDRADEYRASRAGRLLGVNVVYNLPMRRAGEEPAPARPAIRLGAAVDKWHTPA